MSSSRGFKVPLGFCADGELIDPSQASKAVSYRCPGCLDRLVLHQGLVKKPHFAHRATQECSPETVLHKTAKRLVVSAVNKWKQGGPSPILVRRCWRCRKAQEIPLPEKVACATEERRLDHGRIVDVAFLDASGRALAALEVLVSHKVDAMKSADLGDLRWIELRATDIVRSPLHWYPVQDHLKLSHECSACASERAEHAALYPLNGYAKRAIACYQCVAEVPAYAWNGHRYALPVQPPAPRPNTLVLVNASNGRRRYWANSCERCGAVHGDWYLRVVENAVFADLEWAEECRYYGEPDEEDRENDPWSTEAIEEMLRQS